MVIMAMMLEKEAPSSPFRLGQEGRRSHWRAGPGQVHEAHGPEASRCFADRTITASCPPVQAGGQPPAPA